MDTRPSLQCEWQNYCETLYPCADEATRDELRRTFFAGALVLEMLALRVATEKGLIPVPEGPMSPFLEALAPLREELHGVVDGLTGDPEDGA